MGPKLASVPSSLPTPRYAACRSQGRACYAHARSPAPSPAWTRTIVPSLPQSFLPSLQQIRSNQRVSQLHPLSRAHLQPGDTTDRQTERRARAPSRHHTRQAHTTGHRAPSSVIGDGRKCTKQILPRLPRATQPTRKYVEILEMGLCLRTGGASKRLR